MRKVNEVQKKFLSDYGNNTLLLKYLGVWKYVYLLLHATLFVCMHHLIVAGLYQLLFIPIPVWTLLYIVVNHHLSKIIEREYSIKKNSKIFWNKKAYYHFRDERFAEFIKGEYKKTKEIEKLIQILERKVSRINFTTTQQIISLAITSLAIVATWLLSDITVNNQSFIQVVFLILGFLFVSFLLKISFEEIAGWVTKK
ncbi:hypothetical protein QA601_12115 [Chitinispirillales bacterium ANBcel5]|uniref:hypothetical protein n=1 Tax=Cellulosispirillum alkaliphilum TaxID=3039283 RepID=UPI002A5321CD|nr:hypothetical protein [Chitinispirillales bacterium ANBcel5]